MREKILSVTVKIIATEGLDAVSIRYVCEKVGVKAPTIYYYFNDKDGLINDVVILAYKRYTKKQIELVKDDTSLKALEKSWDIFKVIGILLVKKHKQKHFAKWSEPKTTLARLTLCGTYYFCLWVMAADLILQLEAFCLGLLAVVFKPRRSLI